MSQIASCFKCFVLRDSYKLQCCSLRGFPPAWWEEGCLCHAVLTCSVPCIASEWTLCPLSSQEWDFLCQNRSAALAQVCDGNAFEEQSHRSNEN